jgi:hypothetical protein
VFYGRGTGVAESLKVFTFRVGEEAVSFFETSATTYITPVITT